MTPGGNSTSYKLADMVLDIDNEDVLSTFDKLADMGIIRHASSTIMPLVDQDFPVCSKLKNSRGSSL